HKMDWRLAHRGNRNGLHTSRQIFESCRRRQVRNFHKTDVRGDHASRINGVYLAQGEMALLQHLLDPFAHRLPKLTVMTVDRRIAHAHIGLKFGETALALFDNTNPRAACACVDRNNPLPYSHHAHHSATVPSSLRQTGFFQSCSFWLAAAKASS